MFVGNSLAVTQQRGVPAITPLHIFGGPSRTKIWSTAKDTSSTNIQQSGGRIIQFSDKSGNNLHWTQGNAANRMFTGLNTHNGHNVITADKSAALYLESPSLTLTDYAMFFIVKDTNAYPISSNRIGFLLVQDGGGVEILTQFSFGGGSTTQPQFRTEIESSVTQYIDGSVTTDPVLLNADQMYNFNVVESGSYNKTGKPMLRKQAFIIKRGSKRSF